MTRRRLSSSPGAYPAPASVKGILGDRSGLSLMDILVGLTILGFVTVALMNLFLAGITQTRTSGVHSEAAVWVQAEIDYLRGLGYKHACLAGVPAPGISTRVITATSLPCTGLEPSLPPAFDQASVHVENDAGLVGLKRITIELERQAGTVFYRAATYVSDFD